MLNRKTKLAALLLLGWTLLSTVSASELPSDSGPLPPSIMPVVVLQGSDFDMGFQYGQQAGALLVARKEANWASALDGQTRQEVLNVLKAYQWYIKQYAPEIIEEMRGVVAGARAAGHDISYADALLLQTGARTPGPDWNFPEGAESDSMGMSCSSWAAWGSTTTDGEMIIGDSQDRPFFHSLTIVAFPEKGNSFVSPAIAGYLTHKPVMNSKGVCIGLTGGFAQREIDHDYGIPFHCALQHMARFANSAEEAKDMLLSWKLAETPSWLISDRNGNAYVIEQTAAITSVRRPGDFGEDEFIYCTNNYFNEEMKEAAKGIRFVDHAGWLNQGAGLTSVPRNKELWTMFTRYHGKVDLEFSKMMWRFADDPPSYPVNQEFLDHYRSSLGKGWDTKICNLLNSSVAIAQPGGGKNGVMHICTGPANRRAFPIGPKGGAEFQISGTNTFYEIVLGENPEEVVSQAWSTAHERIANVHREIGHLNLNDHGFQALDSRFVEAKSEYYEGMNWHNKARLASGNDAAALYGRSATSFTRSQAHAQQVLHVLVPPATNPEALGLKPYLEDSWSGDTDLSEARKNH